MKKAIDELRKETKKITEFVFEMDSNDQSNAFLKSFYRTCSSMIINGIDLSEKQLKIIEREMKKNINTNPKTPPGIIKMNNQKKYCKMKKVPNFAGDGYCFRCNSNIFDNPKMDFEYPKNNHITSCLKCHYSWCS